MKVCVFGAGAIGGHLAARLAARGDCELSIVARGAQLAAIRDKGVRLRVAGGEEFHGYPHAATDDSAALPKQDIVLVTLKGQSLPAVAGPLASLLRDDSVAVFLMNGVPWWWNYRTPRDGALPLLDPAGALWRDVRPQRALGGVISSSNAVVEPGVVFNGGGNRWTIGEPDGAETPRLRQVVELFNRIGLNGVASRDIRADIWRKIFVNISSNPFAALTRLTSRESADVPGLDDIAMRAIVEALEVAAALGHDLRGETDPAKIVKPAGGRAPGRSSMLQDVDAGRSLEVDGIVGQVQAFGRDLGVPTPTLDVVLPILRGLDKALRLKSSGG